MTKSIIKTAAVLTLLLTVFSCKKVIFISDGEVNEGLASHNNGFPTDYDVVFDNSKVHRIDIVFPSDEWSDMQADLSEKTAGGGGPRGTFNSENPNYYPAHIYYNGIRTIHRTLGTIKRNKTVIRE